MTVLFIMSGVAFAGQEKIAVAANGETPEASVSSRPGLAPFILFFDAEGKFMEAVPNPGKNGIVVAGFLAKRGVTTIVAARIRTNNCRNHEKRRDKARCSHRHCTGGGERIASS